MKVLYTADIHENHNQLDALVDACITNNVETLIIGGDIVPKWTRFAEDVIEGQYSYLAETFFPHDFRNMQRP